MAIGQSARLRVALAALSRTILLAGGVVAALSLPLALLAILPWLPRLIPRLLAGLIPWLLAILPLLTGLGAGVLARLALRLVLSGLVGPRLAWIELVLQIAERIIRQVLLFTQGILQILH